MASNGPLPAHLTLLTSLPSQPAGTKVRFLGCVDSYNSQLGSLELTHAYPSSVDGVDGSQIRAVVDVNVILETLKREHLEAGAWVNVIGYVQKRRKNVGDGGMSAAIQAVMIWGAGSLRLGKYETTVAEKITTGKK